MACIIRRLIHRLGLNKKTVWGWLQLGIVLLALALLVAWIDFKHGNITREAEEARTAQYRLITKDRFKQQLLMSYLDRTTDLMLKQDLHESWLMDMAAEADRAQINEKRKGLQLRFLFYSNLKGSSQNPRLNRRSSQLFDREIL